ncbi:hypothetical protein DIREPILLOW8_212 [Vibrio phage Direpillow8]|uniref:Uncharacterized protein n=1 Tax=Vibrio phage Quinn TaxID=2736265 RepID=A0A6M9Z2F8_9CAUD|nr:hypothetical protein KNV08_gp005 [Vibrio phage Quinn]YP_010108613.1 hypothetical protein KNV08_gp107 [Vibrio phage Quinn]QKN85445.1 hypothetical protein DIREPILLOW8_6 [Vibrio phage Direpillow8]QKN85247.1 hypothetical protein QUINN_5 [Vibrio phage Quinn]QKN85427.1 hypothetical protein QUINN_207 [Vibrio phage Quinn]QKN85632.1 hypothetical protein DIREPILLOW8_212 [Vibrio phage Direpillow8]
MKVFDKVGLFIFVLGWVGIAAVSGHYEFSDQFLISYFFATAFYYLGVELDQ